MRGTIKYVAKKGYGFISPEDGSDDIFFHATNLNGIDFDEITVGLPVEYDAMQGRRGLKATAVEPAQ